MADDTEKKERRDPTVVLWELLNLIVERPGSKMEIRALLAELAGPEQKEEESH